MALGAAYEDDAVQALANSPVVAKPAAEPKFSAWQLATAVPRGVNEALVQVAATGADVLGSIRSTALASPEQRRQMARTGAPIESYSSEAGDELRKFGREFRPDPLTAHAAEQVVYGFSRGATKIVGGALLAGPVGVGVAGLEEGITQSDELRLQGVDFNARTKAGAVQGAGLAIAALPVIGQTRLATAGLYAAGGPGGFIAQQALTREILQGAGYDKIGAQFDPFDPVGLAVATLLPAGFAAYGLRQQKLQRAAASLPDLPPRADAVPPAEPAAPAPIPSRLSPITEAVRAYPTEAVDAARVVLLAERRAAANPGAPDNLRAMDQHEAALTRAEEQIAAGEAVQVADVAPAPADAILADPLQLIARNLVEYPNADPPGMPLAEFKAWARERSQAREQLVESLASRADGLLVPVRDGLFYGVSQDTRPDGIGWRVTRFDADMTPVGHDTFATADEAVRVAVDAADPARLPAAADAAAPQGYPAWADGIAAAIRELQPARTDAPTTPQAANPEAAAPARGAGDAPAAAGAADAGRPAGVEAAGLTPEQARAAAETAKADVIALRKRESVLNSLLECLTNG